MPFDNYPEKETNKAATQHRAANFRMIIGQLKEHDLTSEQIQFMLSMSPQTGRNYTCELRKAGVIDRRDGPCKGRGTPVPIFSLSKDAERVAAYLESLPKPAKIKRGPPCVKYVLPADPFRIPPLHDVLSFFYYGRAAA